MTLGRGFWGLVGGGFQCRDPVAIQVRSSAIQVFLCDPGLHHVARTWEMARSKRDHRSPCVILKENTTQKGPAANPGRKSTSRFGAKCLEFYRALLPRFFSSLPGVLRSGIVSCCITYDYVDHYYLHLLVFASRRMFRGFVRRCTLLDAGACGVFSCWGIFAWVGNSMLCLGCAPFLDPRPPPRNAS